MTSTTPKRYSKTAYMVLCGIFAALTAICSFITIPLGFTPIPLNLGTLAVFLTGGILGKKYGTLSMTVYVLLGAVGVPVFAGFRGGISVLLGPTGGYIVGYIVATFLIGCILDRVFQRKPGGSQRKSAIGGIFKSTKKLWLCIIALILGMAACYYLGTFWFMFSTKTDLYAALMACVVPFVAGDAVKILAAALLIQKLRPLLC